jgi:hypothetical protein
VIQTLTSTVKMSVMQAELAEFHKIIINLLMYTARALSALWNLRLGARAQTCLRAVSSWASDEVGI